MDDQDGFNINDIARRLANIITTGKIFAVDYGKALARVRIGDIETNWLPWVMKDGDNKCWHGVDVDEQVVILSPSGDLNQGIILPSIAKEPISTNPDVLDLKFKDGSEISFNRATSSLVADIKGSVLVKCPTITLDGDVFILKKLNVSGDTTISGNTTLSGGGPAVARLGDAVEVDPVSHKGTITAGSGKTTSG